MPKINADSHIFLLLSIILLIFTRLIGFYTIPIFDDAFITYRYAENFADGVGLVYNSREFVLGTTAPLWAVILSFFEWINIPSPIAARGIGLLSDLALLVIIYNYLSKRNLSISAVIFSLYFSISPLIVRISVGGMESNIFLLMLVLSIYAYTNNRKLSASLILTIAYFLRPESAVLLILLIVYDLIKADLRSSLKMTAVSLLIVIPVLLMFYNYYGNIFSQSVLAKSGTLSNSIIDILKRFFFEDVIIIISTLFTLTLFYVRPKLKEFDKILLLFSVGYLLFYLILQPMVWTWYILPIGFSMIYFSSLSLNYFLEKLKITQTKLLISGIPFGFVLWAFVLFHYGESRVNKNVYSAVSNYFENKNLENKSILANDIGIIGYSTNADIIDSEGLVTPEAVEYSDEEFKKLILDKSPDYLFINTTLNNINTLKNEPLNSIYQPVKRFNKNNKTINEINDSLTNDWKQDYILYKNIHQ